MVFRRQVLRVGFRNQGLRAGSLSRRKAASAHAGLLASSDIDLFNINALRMFRGADSDVIRLTFRACKC